MIDYVVSGIVNCRVSKALEVLTDVERFPEWWPVPVVVTDPRAATFVVKPLPFVQIVMCRRPARSPDQVEYEYVKGPFRGVGTWRLQALQDDPPATKIFYRIQLHPVNALVRMMAATMLFRAKHTLDIERILAGIARRC